MPIALLTAALVLSHPSLAESPVPEAKNLDELLAMVREGWERDCDAPEELRTFEFAEPERHADLAVASRDLRFLGLDGTALVVPSVGPEEIACLLANNQVRTIATLGDARCGERSRLKRLFVSYAERYNAVVQRARERQVLDECAS